MLRCRHNYCCAPAFGGVTFGNIMNHSQPFSPSKECDLRRSGLLQGGGRSSSRALERIAVTSTVRHSAAMTPSSDTPFAGSAYDRLDYDSLDEDTIEIVLSPEDMQSLSQAADEALAEAKATRAMAASLMASLHPTEQAAVAATRPPAPTVAAPSARTAVAAVPTAPKPTTATPDPQTIKLSAAAPASAKPAPVTTPQTIKPSIVTAAPAASRTAAPAATVIPVLAPAPSPRATPAPAPTSSKAPVAAKKRLASQPRVPNVSATLFSQALAQLPLRAAGLIGLVTVTAVAIASISHHNNHTAAPAQTVAAAPAPVSAPKPAAPAPETAAQPDPAATAYTGQPVRVKNPFDHSEVFEFPAGTTLKEARQSVAQILMQRAHNRGVPALHPARTDRHTVARAKPIQQQPVGLVQNSR
jgi:hypothetical protein